MTKLSWTNRQDGVDDVLANDVNTLADAIIDTQDELDNKADLVNGQVPASQLANAPSTTVEDTLTSTSATNALSAKQGKVLNDKVETVEDNIENVTTPTAQDNEKFWGVVENGSNWQPLNYTGLAKIIATENTVDFWFVYNTLPTIRKYGKISANCYDVVTTDPIFELVDEPFIDTLEVEGYFICSIENRYELPSGTILFPNTSVYYFEMTDRPVFPTALVYSADWKIVSSSSVNVVDNLNSDSGTDALSAKQGKVLNQKITPVITENMQNTGKYWGTYEQETWIDFIYPTDVTVVGVQANPSNYITFSVQFTSTPEHIEYGKIVASVEQNGLEIYIDTDVYDYTTSGNIVNIAILNTYEASGPLDVGSFKLSVPDTPVLTVGWNNLPAPINNLTSTDTTSALSAYQGKVLNDRITTALGNIETVLDDLIGGDSE